MPHVSGRYSCRTATASLHSVQVKKIYTAVHCNNWTVTPRPNSSRQCCHTHEQTILPASIWRVKHRGWPIVCLRACSLDYPTHKALPYWHLRHLSLHHNFRHYLMNDMIFEGKERLLNINCVFWFCLQLLFETFLVLKKIKRNVVINVKTSSCKVLAISDAFEWNLYFQGRFYKKNIKYKASSKFVQCEPNWSMPTDGRKDRHDEGCFS